MTNNNMAVCYNRTREAARKLHAAIEEAKAANLEFLSLGGMTYMTPFFYLEDLSTLRTNLDMTTATFANGHIALGVLTAETVQTINIGDYKPMLSLLK
jgi:hypothetical protein